MKKQKIMISQPMNGITKEQIIETRNKFLQFTKENKLKVVNTYFSDDYYSENYIDAICESYKKDFQNLPETEKDKYREEFAKWLKAILSKDIGIK